MMISIRTIFPTKSIQIRNKLRSSFRLTHSNCNNRREMWLPILLLVIWTKMSTVMSVVMMVPQVTNKVEEMQLERRNSPQFLAEFRELFNRSIGRVKEQPKPHPYEISSPIIGVYKQKHVIEDNKINFWQYESETASVFAIQGICPPRMEDKFVIDENIDNTGVSLYAVFDGYEKDFTADYMAYVLMDSLKKKILQMKANPRDRDLRQYVNDDNSINYKKLFRDEIVTADENVLNSLNATVDDRCGSTALIAVIEGHHLVIANVGNSRALMCTAEGNATRLTRDHVPDKPREKKRIEQSGGVVELINGFCYAVDGKLEISRCLGDIFMKRTGHVVPNPDIFRYDLSEMRSEFVVLATHGLWRGTDKVQNDMGDQKVVDDIRRSMNASLLQGLKDLALFASEQSFSDDNQAIIVIKTTRPNKT